MQSYSLTGFADLSVAALLQWITGSSSIPPLGFPRKITCDFLHGCFPECACRPITSTCDLMITLPIHANNEEKMNMVMVSALTESKGFDRI